MYDIKRLPKDIFVFWSISSSLMWIWIEHKDGQLQAAYTQENES